MSLGLNRLGFFGELVAWVRPPVSALPSDLSGLPGPTPYRRLATAVAVAACFSRDVACAQQIWEAGPPPRVVLPACGMLQVSDPDRFRRRRPSLSRFAFDRILEVSRAYLPEPEAVPPAARDLADPLLVLEGDEEPARPLPPFFAGVGTRDPLLPDTRRLAAALEWRGVPCEARYYPGEVHAFHAFVFRRNARRFWRAQLAFLERHLSSPS